MRYKKPKYSNYKKLNKGMSRNADSNKRWWIIGGIVAAVFVLAIVVTIIVVSITNSSNDDNNAAWADEIKEIQIARTPDKLSYYCGTQFEVAGLSVYTQTNGGVFTKLDLNECTITGFDSSVPVESQVITVTYKGFTDTFTVKIKEKPTTDLPTLVSIAMGTLPKTEYKRGEFIDLDGGNFICTYSDGTTKTVDLEIKYTDGFMAAMNKGAGEHEIAVIYEENGIEVTTTYKITITK